jgi:hypothetical protein
MTPAEYTRACDEAARDLRAGCKARPTATYQWKTPRQHGSYQIRQWIGAAHDKYGGVPPHGGAAEGAPAAGGGGQ